MSSTRPDSYYNMKSFLLKILVEETRSTTVGEASSSTRESRHEGYATTHDYRNGASTFERYEDNERK